MPIRVHIDQKCRLIRAVVEGDVGAAEALESIDRVIADPAWVPNLPMLSDHRAVGTPLSTDDAYEITARLRSLANERGGFAGTYWAAVATKPASYGMIRMLSALVEELAIELEVFTSMEEAESWLRKRMRGRRRQPE